MKVDELNSKWGIVDVLQFEVGQGGMPRVRIRSKSGEATVYLHGAHVTHWKPSHAEPVLWLSDHSRFEPGSPIRGGVPVCFPWFGSREDNSKAPPHGFARLLDWQVADATHHAEGDVTLLLRLERSSLTRTLWPEEFDLNLRVRVGGGLELALEVRNCGERPLMFTEALHTYLAVSDVRQISIQGLDGVEYIDKVDRGLRKTQAGPITFVGETDRVYVSTRAACVLHDPGMERKITVAKSGSETTIVWNPSADKARAMADFGDDEWPHMVCIETGNAGDNPVTLGPGAKHTMEAHITVH